LLARLADRLEKRVIGDDSNMDERAAQLIRSNPIYKGVQGLWRRYRFTQLNPEDESRLRFYAQFIRPGCLVFDVGANLGNRSKVFLKLGARVVAFEPQASCVVLLNQMFEKNQRFRLARKALRPAEGTAVMFIGDSHTISSLSKNWIDATIRSGRFASSEWIGRQEVAVTTLDIAISTFGFPSFIKIDVEGFEFEVLKGLSWPIKALSIEVVPEYLENAFRCLRLLGDLAEFQFQFSFGESMQFALAEWISNAEIREWLKGLPPGSFGDLYARLKQRITDRSGLLVSGH
jgi:FkbM family methyltransferase